MSEEKRLDELRGNVLQRIERNERNFKLALICAAVFEALFTLSFLGIADLKNPTHLLLFIGFMGSYNLLLLGLWVLALYLNGGNLRELKAIELLKNELNELMDLRVRKAIELLKNEFNELIDMGLLKAIEQFKNELNKLTERR